MSVGEHVSPKTAEEQGNSDKNLVPVIIFGQIVDEGPLATRPLEDYVSIQHEWISPRGSTALLDSNRHTLNKHGTTTETAEIIFFYLHR
jgi:hypothetical protein